MKSTNANDSQILAQLENISFSFGKKQILDNVSIYLPKGKLISIVGASGSGKSTLLYILGGFLKPANGSYLFLEKNVYRYGQISLGRFRKKNIGFLFQDFRLLPFLSVEQNISFPSLFTGTKRQPRDLDNLLQKLGIDHRRKARISEISGGEAQRTALARALFLRPSLLLLDEPTGNLDEKTESEILQLLQQLAQEGLTLVCVTHSQRIRQASDLVFELKNQKLETGKKNSARRGQ